MAGNKPPAKGYIFWGSIFQTAGLILAFMISPWFAVMAGVGFLLSLYYSKPWKITFRSESNTEDTDPLMIERHRRLFGLATILASVGLGFAGVALFAGMGLNSSPAGVGSGLSNFFIIVVIIGSLAFLAGVVFTRFYGEKPGVLGDDVLLASNSARSDQDSRVEPTPAPVQSPSTTLQPEQRIQENTQFMRSRKNYEAAEGLYFSSDLEGDASSFNKPKLIRDIQKIVAEIRIQANEGDLDANAWITIYDRVSGSWEDGVVPANEFYKKGQSSLASALTTHSAIPGMAHRERQKSLQERFNTAKTSYSEECVMLYVNPALSSTAGETPERLQKIANAEQEIRNLVEHEPAKQWIQEYDQAKAQGSNFPTISK